MRSQAEIITETPYKNGYLLQVFTNTPAGFTGQINLTITKVGSKRSLDANGYYWVLVDKIAEKQNLPRPVVHNMMLRSYGTLERKGDYLVPVTIPDTQDAFDSALAEVSYHIAPTSDVTYDDEGNGFRTYYVIKGSRFYDTREMHRLITGTVEEARNIGIETETPDEIARMEVLYAEKTKIV